VITNIVYLTKDQLHVLETATIISEKLAKVRDCFIFSCYSGLAYAEIAAITNDNIVVKNNINWITMKRKKTQRSFLIPMLPPALAIWDKYEANLPVLSNQKYNKNLKELATLLNLNVNLTTHLARKTFTTTVLLGNNIPLKVASTLLGHSNTRITEKHYAEVTNDLLEQHVESLFDIFK
jgi:integrase